MPLKRGAVGGCGIGRLACIELARIDILEFTKGKEESHEPLC